MDISESQIKVAQESEPRFSNIEFRVGPSENLTFLEDHSVDLITCCQSVHWFDIPRFYQEVDRVLRSKGGVIAVIGYYMTGTGTVRWNSGD